MMKMETLRMKRLHTAVIAFKTQTTPLIDQTFKNEIIINSIEIVGNLFTGDKTTISLSDQDFVHYGTFIEYFDLPTKALKITPAFGDPRIGICRIVYEGARYIKDAFVGTTSPLQLMQDMVLMDSTVTALGASASYTGSARETKGYARISGSVFADQAGTLYVEQSPNGSNWDVSESVAVSAGVGAKFTYEIVCPYARIRYVNGATGQTTFRLYAHLRVV